MVQAGGSEGVPTATGVAATSTTLYVTGYFTWTDSFNGDSVGGSSGSGSSGGYGSDHAFVWQLTTSTGVTNWVAKPVQSGTDETFGTAVAVDASGDAIVTGTLYQSASFGARVSSGDFKTSHEWAHQNQQMCSCTVASLRLKASCHFRQLLPFILTEQRRGSQRSLCCFAASA